MGLALCSFHIGIGLGSPTVSPRFLDSSQESACQPSEFPQLPASSKMPTMMDLKTWLEDQGLTVRELAQELDVLLKTAQDWVYRGKAPSPENQDRLVGCSLSRLFQQVADA